MRSLRFMALATAIVLSACDSDSATAPVDTSTGSITVDATTNWAYVRLGPAPQQVTPPNPTASADWDIAFNATSVMLNGGAAGPGNVSGAWLTSPDPTVAQLQSMTAANQLARFDAVTTAQIPAESQFTADALSPGISGWFTGTAAAGNVAVAPNRSWLIREGTTSFLFTKFRVTQIRNATAAGAGEVTIEFAAQSTPGGAFGPVRTATLNAGATPVYFDFTSGAVSTAANWDVRFDDYNIRVNSSPSGTGSVRSLLVQETPFGSIDAAFAASAPAQVFRSDVFTGIFGTKPWYRYNITGTDNQIWPTFDVYIIKRGDEYYKVQVTSYYSATGVGRHITVRSARLR